MLYKYCKCLRKKIAFISMTQTKEDEMENYLSRITMNSNICHGKPTIRNMRYPVEMILDLLSAGMTTEEIITDYPTIEKEDIQACLQFASRLAKVKSIRGIVA